MANPIPHRFHLLGPQTPQPAVLGALSGLEASTPLCSITAGWQEREGEIDELSEHVGRPVLDCGLYELTEQIFETDQGIFDAHRERQDTLMHQQRLYRIRLAHALEAARDLLVQPGHDKLLDRERRSAIAAVRTLDRQHLRQVAAVHREFTTRWALDAHPVLERARKRLIRRIKASAAVLIAGGHVSVLLNRMRLLGVAQLLRGHPVVAWSAGAMAISGRVVLFHDSPPQGPGDAEVIDQGLGLVRGMVPLPDAATRLQLDDRMRVALFARRFSPDACITLDHGARLSGDGVHWESNGQSRRLTARGGVSGELRSMNAAHEEEDQE